MSSITSMNKVERTAASILKKNKDRKAIAKRLFNSPDGQIVYEWLMDQFYHNQYPVTEETKLSRLAGRRDVMVVLRNVVETKDEI